ncbi:Uncharacterised protein [Burkholderia pseudomallei]|nr:Uncharacterised protein [Burkholderia pseudomallei]VCI62154.1 Uncharacterised protein [Burkholderia pseudomallei]VCI81472.1 Uncharacterised protein [Burkholderia pseudomallei]VCI85630.1 Uncharacterised protein [Burkholderia pseudomallei]VCI96108.1 Uncharacterised protein [Burkholderia pseudomallei]
MLDTGVNPCERVSDDERRARHDKGAEFGRFRLNEGLTSYYLRKPLVDALLKLSYFGCLALWVRVIRLKELQYPFERAL